VTGLRKDLTEFAQASIAPHDGQVRFPHRIRTLSIAVGLTGLLSVAACSNAPRWNASSPRAGSHGDAASVKITSPARGATDVAAGATIAYAAPAGAKVTVTGPSGAAVAGHAGYDKATWVPDAALAYSTAYKVTVASGGTSASSTFTTMAAPAHTVSVHSFLGDGMTYGDAMPVIIQFSRNVPTADRAAVQKRLSVTSTPAQPGAWNWVTAREVHFRPQEKWQPGTKIAIRAVTGGIPLGDGYYGKNGLTVDATITEHPMSIVVDDTTHMLTVTVDGKTVKKIPASLGKASTPSSSGDLVMMTRRPQQEFDSSLGTGGTPVNSPGGYKELVQWVMQLTWSGQFIHAAPWSVASQGHRDVSHGCTNVSTANAKWLYEHSLVGTPVSVRGTPRKVEWGNGWTDWNVSWATYIKGSALPVAE